MEIVIFGIILVGLMVYASTRIKRSAAQAFESETIDNKDFTIEKPAGFLSVLNGDPALSFEAYSREIGTGDASKMRAARAELRVYPDRLLDHSAAAVRNSTNIANELAEMIDGRKYLVIEGRSEANRIALRESFKLAEKDGNVFEFKISVLESADQEIFAAADSMLASFTLK